MTDVNVEQCDEDEANFIAGKLAFDFGINLTGDAIRDLFYASYARHRQAAEKAQQERDAGIADAKAVEQEEAGEGGGREWSTAQSIATAIRSQGHE